MQNDELLLTQVEEFAKIAHQNQTRKYSDDPYIVHPVRVKDTCRRYTADPVVLCGALLHDVLEDTKITESELLKFLENVATPDVAKVILNVVVDLTDIYIKANYPRINRKKRRNLEAERLALTSSEAQTVKYADIMDNTDVTQNDRDFAKVYLIEAQHLLEVMTKGHPKLREEAIEMVQMCLSSLKSNESSVHKNV